MAHNCHMNTITEHGDKFCLVTTFSKLLLISRKHLSMVNTIISSVISERYLSLDGSTFNGAS